MSGPEAYPPPGGATPPGGAVPPAAPWFPPGARTPDPAGPPGPYPQPSFPQYPQQPPYPPYPPQPFGYQLPVPQPAHKPGAIPLRPLGLGDIYDGAFKVIRTSPGATVGSAVLVTAVAMLIPALVTAFSLLLLDLSVSFDFDDGSSESTGGLAANGTLLVGTLLQAFGLIFVTGMIAHVVAAAAVSRRLTLGEAWALTRGKRAKLVGLSALLTAGTFLYLAFSVLLVVVAVLALPEPASILTGIVLGLVSLGGLVFGWVRLYLLAVPPLMLEPVGVLGAVGRGWTLSARFFWRTFGIAVLTVVVTQVAGSLLGIPLSLVGAVGMVAAGDSEVGVIIFLVASSLATVVTAAFVAPFTSAVTTLQYLDLRMRKEGYDVELLTRAGITAP